MRTKESDEKAGSRKDKRDRKEIDIDEIQQKKAKHGNRKKRVEELLVEEVDDILIAPDAELEDDLAPTTLGLTGVARSKRAAAPKAGPRHQFTARDPKSSKRSRSWRVHYNLAAFATDVD